MGTPNYMSPEQVRGLEVDGRTDIWSLGVLIYELVAGRVPFEGSTTSDVIAAILLKEPPPLSQFAAGVPPELESVVKKALCKERDERYQSAGEFLTELQHLKQWLKVKAGLGQSARPVSSSEATVTKTTDKTAAVVTAAEPATAAPTVEHQAVHITSSAEYIVSEIKRHQNASLLALAVIVVAVTAICYGLYRVFRKSAAPFETTRITKLTTGKALQAAVSPDGKYVAYVLDEGAGQQSLWVRQVAIASNIRIVPPAEVQYRDLTYSHDGDYIYYGLLNKKNDIVGALYQVPALGGDSRKLIENVYSPITFSPDDKRFAYIEIIPGEGSLLMVANADGSGRRKFSRLRQPDSWLLVGPAWSPDGKVIACVAGRNSSDQYIAEVRVEDGAVRPIASRTWPSIVSLAWMRDGSGLVMVAPDQSVSIAQLWHLSYPSGEARKITNDISSYQSVSLTSDSKTLVTTQTALLLNIWVMPEADASRATQITSGAGTYYDLSWTPDGKIVYSSNATGSGDIWMIAADGTGQKQLTANAGENYGPSVSPDGRYIVFVSNRTGSFKIWRMNIDGSNPMQLTTGSGKYGGPHCSPDGQWVVYTSFEAGKFPLWKIPIEGGEPIQLNDKFTFKPEVSPDGKLIACFYITGAPEPPKLAVIPFEGGPPDKIFDVAPTVDPFSNDIHWTADGRALTYRDGRNGTINIWSQPLSGGKPVQLTDFKADTLYSFGWSQDGKRLAYSRGIATNDVLMISDLR